MKKVLFALIAIFALTLCHKKDPEPEKPADVTAPFLKLKGKSSDTISLNTPYIDPFVEVSDDLDSLIATKVVTTGSVNIDLKGVYVLKYNVHDEAGNAAAAVSRTVTVINEAEFLAGVYSVAPNCGTLTTSPYNTTVTTSDSKNNRILFSVLAHNNTGAQAAADYSAAASSFTVPTLSNGTGNVFDGSGSIISKGVLSFSSRSGNTSGSFFCTSILTKQ